MSAFNVTVVAVNPKDESKTTTPVSALVDTGSELTWLPQNLLIDTGIVPRRKIGFVTATGERVERQVGYAIIRAEGFETIDDVVFAEKGDMTLLGVRTIEGFCVTVDNIAHKLLGRASLACPAL